MGAARWTLLVHGGKDREALNQARVGPGAPSHDGDGAAAGAQPCWTDPPRLGLLVTGSAGLAVPVRKDTGTSAARVRSCGDQRARIPALRGSSGLPRAPFTGPVLAGAVRAAGAASGTFQCPEVASGRCGPGREPRSCQLPRVVPEYQDKPCSRVHARAGGDKCLTVRLWSRGTSRDDREGRDGGCLRGSSAGTVNAGAGIPQARPS